VNNTQIERVYSKWAVNFDNRCLYATGDMRKQINTYRRPIQVTL